MPAFLKFQRWNRSVFCLLSGVACALGLLFILAVTVFYLPQLSMNIPGMMKFITKVIQLQSPLLIATISLSLLFSYAYIGRLMDGNIPPWIAVIPLLVFYGICFYVIYAFMELLAESNFLFFIAKMKRFIDAPTLANFQVLFSKEWLQFLDEKKHWIDIGILFYVVILLSALFVPSQKQVNRYGAPQSLSLRMKITSGIFSLIFAVVMLATLIISIQLLMLKMPSEYLTDFELFMHYYSQWQTIMPASQGRGI